jgi:hypothetical protein
MHAAAEKSERLQKMLRVLKAHPNGVTTFEIQALTNSMSPATDISELRANGHFVKCVRMGKTTSGRQINRYTYEGRA